MKHMFTLLFTGIGLFYASCTNNPLGSENGNPDNALPFSIAVSENVSREAASASQNDIGQQAQSNNDFAVAMYNLIAQEDGNLFFSPYSITAALGMTAAGAVGSTRQEIIDALKVTLEGNTFDQALNSTDLSLHDHSDNTDGITLRIVNSTWMQTDWKFRIGYLNHLSQYYGAGVNMLDFASDPENCRTIINDWVEDQTNDKILDLLPEGSITNQTALVLTNAIYFLANWLYGFDAEKTSESTFILRDERTIETPMMYFSDPGDKVTMDYARIGKVRAMDFPYKGNRLAMTVLLPDEGEFDTFESSLTTESINELVEALDAESLFVSLPKFKFTSRSLSLKDKLMALGMKHAFGDDSTDFSGIDGSKSLYVSDVLHKAFISVDEAGTEAAAATAVVITFKSVDPDAPIFTVTRPFIYLIRDKQTGTILFMGRILDPSKEE